MRVLIAGTGSGCGKTTVTSGLLQCLVNRGLKTAAFKCGPDYIDPMFYRRITGSRSGNLDPFFSDRYTLRWIAESESDGCDITVIEGVMGYYDGIGFTSQASTYSVARVLDTPVILVINCRGMGVSVGAVLKGFLDWPEITSSNIKGVIFNNMSAKLYGQASQMAESMGVKPLGYLSPNKNITLESRHLGLVTADEIIGLKKKMDMIASEMEKTIDIDGITELASTAPELKAAEPEFIKHLKKADVRIAVASDDAFCFTYRENIDLLELMGCEIVYFSPLHDTSLPENISGMILSGGYPELHAAELAANKEMLRQIHDAVTSGMPVIAECGGFMYLHEELEGGDGVIYRMAGAVKGRCFSTKTLQRFGYINLRACHSGMLCPKDSEMKAHEFHYWDSDNCGGSFIAEKPDGSRHWSCGILTDTMYAGFPHLFFYESPEIAERFVDKCLKRSLGK